ncbi:hypothetical protein [Cellulosilyticum ruminicola]|uniref:hypothetical protein n=1 Tax=Cellulosilyticum ruminicola TaxID=425254 RepID=UPI0006D2AEE5|nr:hypothetical protein [Cellulosilyticum ruminicola]
MYKKIFLFLITTIIIVTTVAFYPHAHSYEFRMTQSFVEKRCLVMTMDGIKTTYHLPAKSYEYASGEEVLR